MNRSRCLSGLYVALLCLVVSAAAQTDTPEMLRAQSRIEAIEAILTRTTNEVDRARFEQRLALERQDLDNRKRRQALESDEAQLASHLRAHAKYVLRESIRAVDSDADRPRMQARKLHYTVLALRADRARLHEKLRRLEGDTDADADDVLVLQEQLQNMDDEILLRSLERDAAEMKHELSKEADRINDAIDALPVSPDPTIRMVHAKRLAIHAELRLDRDLLVRLDSVRAHHDEIVRALALTRSRLAQIEDEIEIENKRRRMESGKAGALKAQLRLLTFKSSTKSKIKDLFEKRVELQEEQLAASDATIEAGEYLHDLYTNQHIVLREDLSAATRRLWLSILVPIAIILVILLLNSLFSRRILPLVYKRDRLFVARRMSGYFVFLVVVVVLASYFLEDLKAIATVLGIAGAALVIALQDLCSSFAGWFIIVASGKFKVGDRVEIDGHLGDVIDIQLLRVTLLEINNWLGIDDATGRIIAVPNSFIFKSKVINFSHVHPFVWSRLDVTVTFETPAEEARELLTQILTEETGEEFEAATKAASAMERRYGVADTTYKPKVYSMIADSGVTYALLYVSHYRRRTVVKNRVNARIVAEFFKRDNINFAYPTERHIPTTEPGMLSVRVDKHS